MMQPRQSQSKEEEVKKKQHKLGQMLHIYELFMHIKKFSKRSNQKLEITVAGPVPVSSTFIFVFSSTQSPFAFFIYLLLCLPALNPHKKNILVLLFNKKKSQFKSRHFLEFFFFFFCYSYFILCVALPCILQHSTSIASRSAMHLLIKICLF